MEVLQIVLMKKVQAGPLKNLDLTIDMENNIVKGIERVDGGVVVKHQNGFTEIPLGQISQIDYSPAGPDTKKK